MFLNLVYIGMAAPGYRNGTAAQFVQAVRLSPKVRESPLLSP